MMQAGHPQELTQEKSRQMVIQGLHKKVSSSLAALLVISLNQKQPNCLPVGEQINNYGLFLWWTTTQQ